MLVDGVAVWLDDIGGAASVPTLSTVLNRCSFTLKSI